MLFQLKIKFRHPCLSSETEGGPDANDACYFDRDSENNVVIPQEHWYGAISEVFKQRGIKHDPGSLRMNTSVCVETIRFRRPYNRSQSRMHEAIPANVEVTFNGMSHLVKDTDKEPFTKEQLLEIFTLIGNHIGISPWGRQRGYGDFNVISIDPT